MREWGITLMRFWLIREGVVMPAGRGGKLKTAVQTLALNEGTVGRGVLLSVAYSIGLGLPFVLLGLAYRRTLGAVRWVRRHRADSRRV